MKFKSILVLNYFCGFAEIHGRIHTGLLPKCTQLIGKVSGADFTVLPESKSSNYRAVVPNLGSGPLMCFRTCRVLQVEFSKKQEVESQEIT